MTDHSDLIAVRCEGCGSAWTDADLARERAANPRLLACCPERKPLTIDQWRARAEAQSLSLSEAREEADHQRKCAVEWHDRMLAAEAEIGRLRKALGRIADGPWPDGVETPIDQCRFDEQTARSALESRKAALADATNDPASSDLSSLRKGAEVAGWRPMSTAPKDATRIDAWVRSTEQPGKEYRHCGAYWNAVQGEWQLGSYHVGQFEHRPEVTHWMPIPERPIDAALISGSRENGE